MKTIRVTCANTIFGTIQKDFTTYDDAAEYMKICAENDVPFFVEYRIV